MVTMETMETSSHRIIPVEIKCPQTNDIYHFACILFNPSELALDLQLPRTKIYFWARQQRPIYLCNDKSLKLDKSELFVIINTFIRLLFTKLNSLKINNPNHNKAKLLHQNIHTKINNIAYILYNLSYLDLASNFKL